MAELTGFFHGNLAPRPASTGALWFLFVGQDLLVEDSPQGVVLARPASLPTVPQFLGTLDGVDCFAARLRPEEAPPAARPEALRRAWGQVPEPHWWIAGRAIQVLEWERTHQFCGACGAPTVSLSHERARRCEGCGLSFYPRVAPAIIVLIHRGEEALLAKSRLSPHGFYSTLAGFVEPGESLEHALDREVLEEVGVRVKNVRYFGSQPWPFPHSLMVGYHAEWESGEIRLDEQELADAQWFRHDALPTIPPNASIARKLIEAWRERFSAWR
ncbi:MAG: NAD(+) diphosphatase [Myxococcota bacterium]|nr:NAD(+) diphosphatase [Myxococcota bacterium]